jgi:tight adherence protein C
MTADTSALDAMLAEHAGLTLALISAAAGLVFALLAWLLSRALATVPPDDRAYKDRPPLGYRLLWQPINWVAHFVGGRVSSRRQAALQVRLGQAGVDFAISPLQFVASRMVGAALVTLLCWWMLASFDQPAPGMPDVPDVPGMPVGRYLAFMAGGALAGWSYPAIWLRDRINARRRELLKTLPFYLDIITLCVEAGLNMQGALTQAVAKGPKGVLRDEFQRLLRDIRAGKSRAASMRSLAARLNESSVTAFTTAVIQAESMGMNLGPILRAQADQRRTERFLRAEKLAMEAPVKLLFPLLAFIFPCTFVVLFFPIAMKFMHSGL